LSFRGGGNISIGGTPKRKHFNKNKLATEREIKGPGEIEKRRDATNQTATIELGARGANTVMIVSLVTGSVLGIGKSIKSVQLHMAPDSLYDSQAHYETL